MAAVPSVPYWQPKLGFLGECVTGLEEVAQAIRVIVNTSLGSVPMRPEFGCDLIQFLDQPLNVVRAPLIREITQAIESWEPRVKVQRVSVTREKIGHLTLAVSWKLKDDTALQTTILSTDQGQDNTGSMEPPVASIILDALYVEAGERGHTAAVKEQPGAEYYWGIENGVILSGQVGPRIVYAAGQSTGQSSVDISVVVKRGRQSVTANSKARILPYRETLSWVTPSLAPKDGASADLTTGAKYIVKRIQTSAPARVRLYKSSAQRLSDRERSQDVEPIGEHGEMFDAYLTEDCLDITYKPKAFVAAMEGVTYAQVDNTGKDTRALTITLEILRLKP